jgi:cell division septum initiation protein DivIVA
VGYEGKENLPSASATDGHSPLRAERPPQRRHGYDVEITDALFGQFWDQYDALARESASLREEVARLEAELARSRDRERSVSDALIAAKQHADAIVAAARREAEEILSGARSDAQERTDSEYQRELEEAQRELERLQRIQQEIHAGLTRFLLAAVELVQSQQVEDEPAAPEATTEELHWVEPLRADIEPGGVS